MSDLDTLEKIAPSSVETAETAVPLPEGKARSKGFLSPAPNAPDNGGSLRRIRALIRKEMLEIVRDPSSMVVTIVLPVLLLFLFGFGISFDVTKMRVGVVLEEPTPETVMFEASLANTPYFRVRVAHDRRAFLDDLTASRIDGVVDSRERFQPAPRPRRHCRSADHYRRHRPQHREPRHRLCAGRVADLARPARAEQRHAKRRALISTEPRVWFNPELESRRFLVPGSIALILMMIGSLLTALVVAREWERGTIEALLATPASVPEFLIGKVVPNFFLGLTAMAISVLFAVFIFDVPLRGSIFSLLALTTAFLLVALASGLYISTVARTQFLASQIAMMTAFLPGLFFSGFIFELSSMPTPLQAFSAIVPARYFVKGLQTVFLAGDIASVLVPCVLILTLMSGVLMALTAWKSKMRLD